MQIFKVVGRLAGTMAMVALLAAAVPVAAPVAADGPAPSPAAKRCVFRGRTPAPNSIVRTRDVFIAITVSCNKPVGRVSVFLDGVRQTTEGLGPDVFSTNEFFTALNLRKGLHRVSVHVESNGSTSWVFTVK